jgi:hypothetical protein
MKKCTCKTCKTPWPIPLSEFGLCKSQPDGLQYRCKECSRRAISAHKKRNIEKVRQYCSAYQSEWRSKNREKHLSQLVEWREKNKTKTEAYSRRRQAAIKQQTPAWLTAEQKKEITEMRALAKELSWLSNSPLEIDHIIPIQGRHVRGLNVPWNIQIIPKCENMKKHNKII